MKNALYTTDAEALPRRAAVSARKPAQYGAMGGVVSGTARLASSQYRQIFAGNRGIGELSAEVSAEVSTETVVHSRFLHPI